MKNKNIIEAGLTDVNFKAGSNIEIAAAFGNIVIALSNLWGDKLCKDIVLNSLLLIEPVSVDPDDLINKINKESTK